METAENITMRLEILKKYRDLNIDTKQQLESIQKWVQRIFLYLFANDVLTTEEIELLHNKTYSKETFNIDLPLLVDDIKSTKDHTGNNRYWQKPIGGYYICSQWNLPKDRLVEENSKYEANIKCWLSKVLPNYSELRLDRRYFVSDK